MTKHLTPWLLVPAVALSLALGACGGGEEAPSPAEPAEPAAEPAAAIDPSQVGTITGVVSLANGPDPDNEIKMNADPVCEGLHEEPVMSQTRVTDDAGNLANVFVYVKSGLEGKRFDPPADPKVLDQQGCLYKPHVQGVMTGQTLKVVNSDPTLHNVHATPKNNPEFNQAQPFQGMELERRFENVEVAIPVKCDVHPWMQSYISVLEHPFFTVSAEDGSFTIEGVPAGSYTLELWHELLGTETQDVTVEAGATAEIQPTFTAGG